MEDSENYRWMEEFEPEILKFIKIYSTKGSFSDALEKCKTGSYISRESMLADDKVILYVEPTHDLTLREGTPYYNLVGDVVSNIESHLDICRYDSDLESFYFQPGWVPAQEDLMANDWIVLVVK